MKRFWTAAAACPEPDGWSVALDGKPVRTPAGARLIVPTAALAEAVAAEWNAVAGEVRPAAMRLTGLANVGLDRAGPELAGTLAAYAGTDLLCYRAEEPPELAASQAAAWDPLLDWARARFDVAFTVAAGVMPAAQPPATLARMAAVVGALSPWRLAGLHPVVTVSGSLLIGLAVLHGALGAAGAWEAGAHDELWQAQRWGDDPLAAASRAERRAELEAGVRFLELVG